MPNQELDEREKALRYAARLKGLSLIRTGDTFALATCALADATLDQVAEFLAAEPASQAEHSGAKNHRRADLRALLKAEHAIIAELQEERRRSSEPIANPHAIEGVLAEIRRRLLELGEARAAKDAPSPAWQEIKHSLNRQA